MKRLLLAALMAMLIAAPASAAKPITTGELIVSSPVFAHSTFTVSGCGFAPSSTIRLVLNAPGVLSFWGAGIGADGCIVPTTGWTAESGEATLEAFVQTQRKPISSTQFVVLP